MTSQSISPQYRAPVLAIDLGTSHVKAALIAPDGVALATAHSPLTTTRGADGLMQQQVDDWHNALCRVIAQCLTTSLHSSPLAAIAFTGQMQDLVLLDAHGQATHPVILYSDTHAATEHADLVASNPTWAPSVAVTPPPGPDSLPPKILSVTRHAPEAMRESTAMLFSASGWAVNALADVRVCDRLTASTTGFFDPRTDDWNPLHTPEGDALVPAHIELPKLVDPGIVGRVTADAARTFGVPTGTPVVMALGDAGSATDGMVGSTPGSAYLHVGTTGWVAFVDPTPARDLPLPQVTGRSVTHHRLAHPAGHLAIARLPEAGEALERARKRLLKLSDPHSPHAHAHAEAALAQAYAAPSASRATVPAEWAYTEVVRVLGVEISTLLARLGVYPERLPATGGVMRSPMIRQILEESVGAPIDLIPDAEAGLISCARVAFDALGVKHRIGPLVSR